MAPSGYRSEAAAAGSGYAAELLHRGQALASGRWVTDAAWIGGLAVAAGATWRGLAAHPAMRLAVAGYLAVEGLFYLWSKHRFRHLSLLSGDCPDTSRLVTHFERFLQLRDVFCIREFLSGWFLGAPAEAVLRGNVEEFVAYGFHCKLLHELSEREQAAIRQFIDRVEETWDIRFAPGFNPDLPFMAHVWEPLRAYHKPLALFALTELLARVAHVLMWLMGFRPFRHDRFTYWLAPPLARAVPEAGTAAGAAAAEVASPPLSPVAAASWSASRSPGLKSLRRHSTGEGVAEAMHSAAEHALDATLTVTSTAAAAVAAQHPNLPGAQGPLSPRPSGAAGAFSPPQRSLALAPVGSAAAFEEEEEEDQAGSAHTGKQAERQQAGAPGGQTQGARSATAAATAAAAPGGRRRNKGDSAADFASNGLLGNAAAAAAAARGESPFGLAAVATAPQATSPADSAGSGAGGRGAASGARNGSNGGSNGTTMGSTRPDVPIVFLHGVGFGVLPYLHLVRDIQHACGATPILMVEVPHVALRLCWEARAVDDVAHAVAAMLARHGYRRACIVGHSYGTFVGSRLCQLHPRLVHSACLLDPVAMLTCYPQLLYNFIYKEPGAANLRSVGGAVDLLRFMCSRDLTIAQAFCRKFHWGDLMLWPQDLPRRSLVVLSGRDDLVPSDLVMEHLKLTRHPAKVMHHPGLGHGGILLYPSWQAQFVANLREMLVQG